MLRALAPRPRPGRAHRDGGRARHAGRHRGAHGGGRRRRRHPAAHPQSDAGESSRGDRPPSARRLPGAASADARRPRALRGRGGGHGHRPHAGGGAGRRGTRRRGVVPAAVRHRQPGRRRAGRAAALRRHRLERMRGRPGGRRRDRRGGLRVGRPRRAARHVDPAGHRRADGATRGGGRVGRGERTLHRARGRRRAGTHAHRRGRGARRPRERGARGGARCRREFRDPEQLLSGVRARRLGSAPPGPAGEVDERATRGVSGRLPGPRSRLARRAGARRHRRVPGLPYGQYQQHRRPRRFLPPAQQGHGHRDHGLPRAGRGRARARGGHHHVADHAVPQRRPPRGDVHHGAADRPRRPPARLRPSGAATAQPGARRRHAVPQRRRHDLRQRRLSRRARSGGGARGLEGLRDAPGRGAPARALSRDRHRQLPRDQHGRSARARPHHRTARRAHRPGAGHALVRAGARDELRPAPGRVVRRGARRRAADHRRHRRHRHRGRRPFRASAAAGRHRDGQGV